MFLKDRKRVREADNRMGEKGKRRRHANQLKKTRREEALRKAGTTYEAGGF